jgi:hypothetical protein
MANVGQTAHRLYERLHQINRLQIPVGERREILETLRPPLDLVLRSLERHYANQSLPLKGRSALVARLSRELLVMAVLGYKIIDEDLRSGPSWARALHKGRHAEVLHRSLDYLGRLLLHNYELYRKQPAGIWREIHGLRERALAAGLDQRPVDDEGADEAVPSTVVDAYKRLLLLALSGPHRLLQGEVTRVFHALGGWAPLCRLCPPSDPSAGAALFAVDPSTDGPPFVRGQNGELSGGGWLIDTERLARELDDLLELRRRNAPQPVPGAERPTEAPDALSDELLSRLALAWGLGPARRGDRVAGGGALNAVCGIDGVLGLFADSYAGGAGPAASRQETGVDLPEWAASEPSEDIALGGPAPASWTAARRGSGVRHRCEIVDRGSGGYQLRVMDSCERGGRVGDLMGLSEDRPGGAAAPWRIGVLRWVKAQSPDDVQMGVEVLADAARPVLVRRIRLAPGGEERLASLLLKGAGGRPDTLLTPAFFGSTGDRLVLVEGDTEVPIAFVQALERTRSFVQFRFAPEQASSAPAEAAAGPGRAPARPAKGPPPKTSQDDEFADLWETL